MPVYKNCEMTSYDAAGEHSYRCEVRIGEGSLAVSYDEDGTLVVYDGYEQGPGHYKMVSKNVKGRGTLHRFDGDDIFEGMWLEEGWQGMWRIQIDD